MLLIEIREDNRIIAIFYDTDLKASHKLCQRHNDTLFSMDGLWSIRHTNANIEAIRMIDKVSEKVGE